MQRRLIVLICDAATADWRGDGAHGGLTWPISPALARLRIIPFDFCEGSFESFRASRRTRPSRWNISRVAIASPIFTSASERLPHVLIYGARQGEAVGRR